MYYLVVHDIETQVLDQLRNAPLHLPPPERRRHFAEHLVQRIKGLGILPDQRHGEIAAVAQDAPKFVQRADYVIGR